MKVKLVSQIIIASCVSVVLSCQQTKKTDADNDTRHEKRETVIALGSCYDGSRGSSSIFASVVQNSPDLWIWLGDIIYGDSHNMDTLRAKYNELKTNNYYKGLRDASSVIGIWDDHDYGENDGGKFYSMKRESKEELFEFLDVSKKAKARGREGAYSSYILEQDDKKVKVLLLDARYFRDTLYNSTDGYNRYDINTEGDILGEEQWEWLRQELLMNEADVHLIGSGYQIIPTEHPYEKWANFPKARTRLFDLLQETKPNLTVLISGDRHMSELAKVSLNELPYPLYEFTSSGLTHTWDNDSPEPNQYRVGSKTVKEAFGLIRINWTDSLPQLRVEVRGVQDSLYSSIQLKFDSK